MAGMSNGAATGYQSNIKALNDTDTFVHKFTLMKSLLDGDVDDQQYNNCPY